MIGKIFSLKTLLSFVFLLALANVATAQSQAFVSAKSGNDINPCTLELPCRSFSQALAVVQPRGEVVALSSGDYAPFTVNKSVSVYAAPGTHPTVVATTNIAITVSAANSDLVTLSGLTLNGMGTANYGVNVFSGTVNVEKCVVENFKSAGIYSGFDNVRLSISDTIMRHNGMGAGFDFPSTASKATLVRCRIEKSTTRGIFVGGNSRVVVRGSVLSGNGTGASVIVSVPSRAELSVEDCLVSDNVVGLNSEREGAFIRVANSIIVNNGNGIRPVVGGAIVSRRNNTVEGNTDDGAFTGTFFAK